MRVLAIVQAWNSKDPIRGFIVRWMEELAARVTELVVLTLEQREGPTRDNIRIFSLGKEDLGPGSHRAQYLVVWHRVMRSILRDCPPDVVFTHMSPIFTVLAAPYLRPKGIPIVTWFAHPQVTPTLKFAHHLSDRMVTSAPEAYRYKKDKVTVLSQGIDTEYFAPDATPVADPPLILAVGRISPVKDLLTLVRAVRILRDQGHKPNCAIVGEAPARDRAYGTQVLQEVSKLGLKDCVRFIGPQTQFQVPGWYRRCFVYVNCSPADHSLDKTVLEAMACGRPVLTSIKGFETTLGSLGHHLIFRQSDPEDLASKLQGLFTTSQESLTRLGQDLRQRTVQQHSLTQLSGGLVALLNALATARASFGTGNFHLS